MKYNKIFIVSENKEISVISNIINHLSDKYNFSIAEIISTDNSTNIVYSIEDAILAFRNNAFIWCVTRNNETYGLPYEEYVSNNIFYTPIDGFINIPKHYLDNSLVILVDNVGRHSEDIIYKMKFVEETLQLVDYIYCISSENIGDIITEIEDKLK